MRRMPTAAAPHVLAVASSAEHGPRKTVRSEIRLVVGEGVAGDAHRGPTVRHRSRVARDPSAPNLRQVHLLQAELLDELAARGFDVAPGVLGENVTTRGLDLLALAAGTRLALGDEVRLELTGLRNPCAQLDGIQPGLMAATLERDADGGLVRRAGVMAVVLAGGVVRAGDPVRVEPPPEPWRPLAPV